MPSEKSSAATVADLSGELDAISSRLVDARMQAQALDEFPGTLPDSLTDAYRIQSASISRWPDHVVGWKVGGVPPSFREHYGADRLAGPIFGGGVQTVASQEEVSTPIFEGGFAAIEAEFVIRTSDTITPQDSGLTRDDLLACIASIHIGAEIASSPMEGINRMGPGSIVSDFGNNAGLVVGPSIDDWQSRMSDAVTTAVSVNDALVGTVKTSMNQGVLQAFEFLVGLSADRQLVLPSGTYISCGAMTGIHDVITGSKATVDFEGIGQFSVNFTRKQAAV